MCYIHAIEYYVEILTYATTQMNCESSMLSKIRKSTKGQLLHDAAYMRPLEKASSWSQKVE